MCGEVVVRCRSLRRSCSLCPSYCLPFLENRLSSSFEIFNVEDRLVVDVDNADGRKADEVDGV